MTNTPCPSRDWDRHCDDTDDSVEIVREERANELLDNYTSEIIDHGKMNQYGHGPFGYIVRDEYGHTKYETGPYAHDVAGAQEDAESTMQSLARDRAVDVESLC